MMRTQRVRHTGRAVLDLCYVACGRVDAPWEFGPRRWDVGGSADRRRARRPSDKSGRLRADLEAGKIRGSNRKLLRAMRERIAKPA
jgi:myo-inositol-1(or 4)-monophosphatase